MISTPLHSKVKSAKNSGMVRMAAALVLRLLCWLVLFLRRISIISPKRFGFYVFRLFKPEVDRCAPSVMDLANHAFLWAIDVGVMIIDFLFISGRLCPIKF
jgi:hypothetical protein